MVRVFYWPQGHTLVTKCGRCPACMPSERTTFICKRLSTEVEDVERLDSRCPLPIIKEG